MKKTIFLLLVSTLFALSSCGNSSSQEQSTSQDSSEQSSQSYSSEDSSLKPSSSSEDSSIDQSSEDISEDNSSESSSEEGSSTEEYDPSIYYDGYYSELISWENSNDLINQLYDILHGGNYHPLAYAKPNWTSNKLADRSLTDFSFVDAVYSSVDIEANRTQKGWQREHAFPATLMTGSTSANAVKFLGRATDFHNLFASDASGNMSRGNKNYGIADPQSPNYQDRTTDEGLDGYSFDEKTFEPSYKDKGRLARSIFYMATMYSREEYDSVNDITMKGLTIVEEPVNYVPGNNCHFSIGNLSSLLEWNNIPVDFLEMQHNNSVYQDVIPLNSDSSLDAAQGNRNPFVDYPELVEYAFGSKQQDAGELRFLKPSYLCLNMDKDDLIDHYAIKEAKREYGYGDTLNQEDYQVVSVYTNQNYYEVKEGVTNDLLGHTFTQDDGELIKATIEVDDHILKYDISLNPMNTCSYYSNPLTKDGLTPNKTSRVTYNQEEFDVTVSGGSSLAISNDNQEGGYYMGSNTSGKEVNKVTIVSKNSYNINKAYIKCRTNNKTSSFRLTIKVGETIVLNQSQITYNEGITAIYGASFTPLEGQVSFIFQGANALRIYSFAFNVFE